MGNRRMALRALILPCGFLLAAVATAPPAFVPAANPPRAAASTEFPLERRIAELERRLAEFERSRPAPVAERLPPPAPEPAPASVKQAIDAAAIKKPSVVLSGFLQADTGFFSQDAVSHTTLGDIQDGTDFRRARLQGIGAVSDNLNLSIEFDFAQAGRPSFQDVFGEITGVPFFGNIRIGQYRQPTSMDSLSPIREYDLFERSLPFQAFDPFRRVGIMAYDHSLDEKWTWAYSLFRTGGFLNLPLGDSRFGQDIGDNGGWSFAGRLTHLLYYDDLSDGRHLFHVGGSYDYSRLTGSTVSREIYDARVIPEFFLGDPAGGGLTSAGTPFFADTGRLNADQFQFYTIQLAGQWGSARFQSEYFGVLVRQIGNRDVYYDGAYLKAGYFLTGEHRPYNRKWGIFDRPKPYTEFFGLGRRSAIVGWGAWEIMARASYVNLNHPDARPLPSPPQEPPLPNPGRLMNLSIGLNWIWNQNAEVQIGWIHAMLDNAFHGDSDTDIYAMRFEVDF